ncbi:MAG TPA: hypothetical protein VGB57_05415 [Allosphingosinicella sp.]|jgi:hypothetical protein
MRPREIFTLARTYREMAGRCREPAARVLLDMCARGYEEEAARFGSRLIPASQAERAP